MKVSLIIGSHRHESQSAKVGRFVEKELQSVGTDTYFCSLADNPLPLWDEEVWQDTDKWKKLFGPISKELQASAAFVVISPEWSGMAPAGLKNFFLLCGNGELAHKPGMLIGVSSGMGGAYPVAELRMSSYKNTRLCYVPDHVLVRHAETMLNGDTPADAQDEKLRKRIAYSVKVLNEYGKALQQVRESGILDLKTYPSGM